MVVGICSWVDGHLDHAVFSECFVAGESGIESLGVARGSVDGPGRLEDCT